MEFLTKEELIALTGYRQFARQAEKLEQQHYPIQSFDRFGMPLVIYKDVFGFRRDGKTDNKTTNTKWQPPPP